MMVLKGEGSASEPVCVSGCEEWLLQFAKQNKITDNSVWLIGYLKAQTAWPYTVLSYL